MVCEPGGPPAHDRELRNARLVREFGWGVTGVLGGSRPDWAYSIGLWHSYGSVEICLLGVAQQPAMRIVNEVGRLVRDGLVLNPDTTLPGVLHGHVLTLAPVHGSWYEQFFGAAIDYYQRPPFPMVQLLWPDPAGPTLRVPKDEHPPPAPWPHPQVDPGQLAFTYRRILDGHRPVDCDVHEDDGAWQFLDGDDFEDREVVTAQLGSLATQHDLLEFLDLPPGWHAWRRPDGSWQREPLPPQ